MAGILSSLLGGANKFSNEVLAPTTGLGKLGAYLSAAAGNPLGEASLAYQKDAREQQGTEMEKQLRMLQIQKALQGEQHYFQTNDGSQAVIGPDGQTHIVYQDPHPKSPDDAPVTLTLPGNRVYSGPRSGLLTALGGGAPPAAGAAPDTLPADFNFGGQTPPASGSFPRR